jgi:hypothetical protein
VQIENPNSNSILLNVESRFNRLDNVSEEEIKYREEEEGEPDANDATLSHSYLGRIWWYPYSFNCSAIFDPAFILMKLRERLHGWIEKRKGKVRWRREF